MADDKSNLAALEAEAVGPDVVSEEQNAKMAGIPDTSHRNLTLILDIPLRVAVELGRTKMVVNDLLNLGQGSVIELNKLAGEPMEVLVNDKLVARGEAVVVNEKFGVRLTDIISPSERVEQLK
ncbi:MAG TPA: flagellar motor switch protein FliN [Bdellovibrionales bacterium]|nr:flagellar motor switch protein FliN [Bdellovibrionales bacterium]